MNKCIYVGAGGLWVGAGGLCVCVCVVLDVGIARALFTTHRRTQSSETKQQTCVCAATLDYHN